MKNEILKPGRDTGWLLFLIESVELNLEDGPEMAGHSVVTLGEKTQYSCCRVLPRQSSVSRVLLGKMVLKLPFFSGTEEETAPSLFRSPRSQSSLTSLSFTWKVTLRWPFVGGTGEDSLCVLFRCPSTKSYSSQ